MVKSVFRVVYNGSKILVRAVLKSVQEEIEISRQLAKIRYQDQKIDEHQTKSNAPSMLTLDEAKQILNVRKLEPEEVESQFKYLFEANNKSTGGTFYLQSKVFRAKERIDYELKRISELSGNEEEKKTNRVNL